MLPPHSCNHASLTLCSSLYRSCLCLPVPISPIHSTVHHVAIRYTNILALDPVKRRSCGGDKGSSVPTRTFYLSRVTLCLTMIDCNCTAFHEEVHIAHRCSALRSCFVFSFLLPPFVCRYASNELLSGAPCRWRVSWRWWSIAAADGP